MTGEDAARGTKTGRKEGLEIGGGVGVVDVDGGVGGGEKVANFSHASI